jgi:uncharacterized protein (TIGR00255 family)
MTGYGAAQGPLGGGLLALEVRTVNHRHLSVQFKLPHGLQQFEMDLRGRLRERLDRGHVTVSARWTQEPERPTDISINMERARAVTQALLDLRELLGLDGDVDLGFVARQPEVFVTRESDSQAPHVDELLELLDAALDSVVQLREREGAALEQDLAARLTSLEQSLASVEAASPGRSERERDRLRAAVEELLDGRKMDEDRLAQEIALLADKLDITEETVRLRTHLDACRQALSEDAPSGRQLAFLGQEMLREINTIGSKANDADIAQTVIGMKGELEKVREQVENVE